MALAGFVKGQSYWVDDPNDCPVEYQAQTCSGADVVCGYDDPITYCSHPDIINTPDSPAFSTTDYSGSFNGGFIIDCYDYDGVGVPYCNNTGSYWCDRNSTCYTTQLRQTRCIQDLFGVSNCEADCRSGRYNCYGDIACESTSTSDCDGSNNNHYITATCDNETAGGTCECDTNYFACDGSITDADGCEHLAGASCGSGTGTKVDDQCYDASNANCTSASNSDCDNSDADGNPRTCNVGNGCEIIAGASCGFGTGTYESAECVGAGGNCTRTGDNLDCDNDDGDANEITCNGGGNGCEIDDNGACSIGVLVGTYDGCFGGAGNCVVSKYDIWTRTLVNDSGVDPILWLANFGSSYSVNITTKNSSGHVQSFWGIDNDGCIVFNDTTTQCTAPVDTDTDTHAIGAYIWLYNDTTHIYFNGTHFNTTIEAFGYINESEYDNNSIIRDINTSWVNGVVTDAWVNESGDTMTGNLSINANLSVNSLLIYENVTTVIFKTGNKGWCIGNCTG